MAFFLLKYLLFICLYELLYIYLSYTITKLNNYEHRKNIRL